MEPMGCGIEGYIELNPDWNGNLDAMEAMEAAEDEAAAAAAAADGGVGIGVEGEPPKVVNPEDAAESIKPPPFPAPVPPSC